MPKYIINGETLTGLADALRKVTGEDRTYTPEEMIETVSGILDAAVYILKDDTGKEYVGVVTENEVTLDATANDIRIGKVAATADGITEGTKEIPSYNTTEGFDKIPAGSELVIEMFSDRCEYTKLQAIICAFNSDTNDSVAAEKVAIDGKIYAVNSTEVIAEVSVDTENQTIKLGITNNSDNAVLIRYFTYKEVY